MRAILPRAVRSATARRRPQPLGMRAESDRPRSARRTAWICAAACLSLLTSLTVAPAVAGAGWLASAAAAPDQAISGVPASMWQTNASVNSTVTTGGVIYAGGLFTAVRPPGVASGGAGTVSATYLAAFSASTGAFISSFKVTLNGKVNQLALSPAGNILYVAGQFSTVNGLSIPHLVAISLPSGAPITAFNPKPNKGVTAVTASASTVWFGGDFTTVGGKAVNPLVSVSAANGALNTAFSTTLVAGPASIFSPPPTPHPLSLLLSPASSRLLVGGGFLTVDGQSIGGMASVDPVTGALQDWAANSVQSINVACSGRVSDIVTDGTNAYVTAIGDPPGCYEGTYSANITTGQINWNEPCLGAGQALAVLNGILYKGSHQHDCGFAPGGDFGGFVGGLDRDDFLHHHLIAQNASNGSFVHWTPNTNGSGSTNVGPLAMTTDGSQIIVGGDFTTVDGSAQQGITRFTATGNQATPLVPGKSYKADPFTGAVPIVAANLAITVQPTAANTLTILIPTVEDYDSGHLTYQIYRDNNTKPIATLSAESWPWSRPVLRYDDTGLVAGSTHRYTVTASDGIHTSAKSTAVSGTVAAAAPASLAATYTGLSPQVWWRLNDSGTTAADSSGNGNSGTIMGTTGGPGVITGDTSVSLDGSSNYIYSNTPISEPGAFTEAAWFKTTTTQGGVIMAQSDQPTGSGGNTDRFITMDNNGGIVFGVEAAGGSPFGPVTIAFRNQGPIWNDGKWHLVVGVYDGNSTVSLYVDGVLQGSSTGDFISPTATAQGMPTSYLRVGYADMSQVQEVFGFNYYGLHWPASQYFAGSVDEAAAFNGALSTAQIQSMYAAGVGNGA
jgi:hypothetical protein